MAGIGIYSVQWCSHVIITWLVFFRTIFCLDIYNIRYHGMNVGILPLFVDYITTFFGLYLLHIVNVFYHSVKVV